MSCPNNCGDYMKQVMIEVDPELFASVRQSYILDRKGVVGYDWENKDGMLIETLHVDQSSYKMHNYFKHRRELESESGLQTVDISNGVVEIRYNCDIVVFGEQCLNCDSINNAYTGGGDDFSSESVYDKTIGSWMCATLM